MIVPFSRCISRFRKLGVLLFVISCSDMVYDIPGRGPRDSVVGVLEYCSGDKLSTTSFAAGTGTSTDPWMICNAQQLAMVSSSAALRDDYYKLATNISLSDYANWTPLAAIAFQGSLDGNGYSISDLTTDWNTSYVGLFAQLGAAAVVSNLTINVTLARGTSYVGGLAGIALLGSTVSKVHVIGSLNLSGDIQSTQATTSYTGGLIGYARSTITRSSANVNLAGGQYVGGLIGRTHDAVISESRSSGSLNATYKCSYAGGLVGYASGVTQITKSKSTVSVTGISALGGLVGYLSGSSVQNSYATGNIVGSQPGAGCWVNNGSTFAGGLVGVAIGNAALVQNSYATGSVTTTGQEQGALLGLTFTNPQVNNNFSTGAVSGTSGQSGGVIGSDGTVTTSNTYWDTFSTGIGVSTGSSGTIAGHTGIDTSAPGNEHYFHDSNNAPLSSWDFSSIWYTDATHYPVLLWELE